MDEDLLDVGAAAAAAAGARAVDGGRGRCLLATGQDVAQVVELHREAVHALLDLPGGTDTGVVALQSHKYDYVAGRSVVINPLRKALSTSVNGFPLVRISLLKQVTRVNSTLSVFFLPVHALCRPGSYKLFCTFSPYPSFVG